jgi:SAM-dependent methyltransferase
MQRKPHQYLLGDSKREAARLARQAALWDRTAEALFDRLGVGKGWSVLEVGPGQGSLHRKLRARVNGPIDAVEPSAAFVRRVRKRSKDDGLGAGRIWQTTLGDAPLPKEHYDLIFARWVFLFLPDPEAHVRKLAAALRPGGLLAIEDYHRETLDMVPRPTYWRSFLAADRKFFAAQGSDASIGSKLPALYAKAGLEIVETTPTVKAGRPGSDVWMWLTGYFRSVADRYAAIPPLTRSRARRLWKEWDAAERSESSLLIAPMVLDVVGRKGSSPAAASQGQ